MTRNDSTQVRDWSESSRVAKFANVEFRDRSVAVLNKV